MIPYVASTPIQYGQTVRTMIQVSLNKFARRAYSRLSASFRGMHC